MISILVLFLFACSPIKSLQLNNNMDLDYDSLSNTYVYTFVEQMPKYKGGDYDFIKDFSSLFHYSYKEKDSLQTILRLEFIIDSTGHLIAPRIQNKGIKELTHFEKNGIKTLKRMQSWVAGKQDGKNVNVLIRATIHIDLR